MESAWEDDGSNRANLYAFATQVDTMLNNEVGFMVTLAIGSPSSTILSLIGTTSLSAAGLKAGLVALGITSTLAFTYAWHINSAKRLADRYYAQIIYT